MSAFSPSKYDKFPSVISVDKIMYWIQRIFANLISYPEPKKKFKVSFKLIKVKQIGKADQIKTSKTLCCYSKILCFFSLM